MPSTVRVFALFLSVSAVLTAAPARVWQESLTIPTYELGAPDPNPALLNEGGRRPSYPYPMLDTLTNHRVEKAYKAVYLARSSTSNRQAACSGIP